MLGYSKASLRGVLPVDPASGEQGVSFDLPDGSVVRLLLDGQSARNLVGWMADYQSCAEIGATVQSTMSSGGSPSDGSPQDGQNV